MGCDIMQHGHGLASISRFDRVNGYLYRSMEMIFWLPQAEAALAQVEGH
jgi:hypothetical protein